MATVIRFARHGTKKKPYFRIVVQDKTSPRDGKYIEHIGAFNPVLGGSSFSVKRDRLEYWLSTGAQLSESVRNLLKVRQPEGHAQKAQQAPPPAKKTDKRETHKETNS